MPKITGVELKRAQLVPSSMFAGPEQVLASNDLSTLEKITILRRWEFDERGLASTGAPCAGAPDARLTEIRHALGRLEARSIAAARRVRH